MALAGQNQDDEVQLPQAPRAPWLLELWFWCSEYHALPHAGGIIDQPWLLFHSMRASGQAYQDYQRQQLKMLEG
jgi:hypothetical protein